MIKTDKGFTKETRTRRTKPTKGVVAGVGGVGSPDAGPSRPKPIKTPDSTGSSRSGGLEREWTLELRRLRRFYAGGVRVTCCGCPRTSR